MTINVIIDSPLSMTLSVPTPIDVETVGMNDFQTAVYVDDFISCYTNTDEFAVTARYYHSALRRYEAYPVNFDDPTVALTMGNGVEVSEYMPQILICEALMKHRPIKNDRCFVSGKNYFVEKIDHDGVGGLIIYLRIS